MMQEIFQKYFFRRIPFAKIYGIRLNDFDFLCLVSKSFGQFSMDAYSTNEQENKNWYFGFRILPLPETNFKRI
jgi:hypothetical protein